MPRFSEETLNGWRKPPSDTEETKLSNIERMVKECINTDSTLSSMSSKIKIFGQGSYVNDTNVRLNSDVDLNVQYKGGFYFDLPPGTTRDDFGLNTPFHTPHPLSKTMCKAHLSENLGVTYGKSTGKTRLYV